MAGKKEWINTTPHITAEYIATHLPKGKKSGNGWVASCPAHDDKNPSLSITQVEDTILYKCHAGCEQKAVLSALMDKNLWPRFQEKGSQSNQSPKYYDYTDSTGKLVFQVVRSYEPNGKKKFSQRYRNASGEWIYKRPPEAAGLLYREAEVVKAIKENRPVFIPEGEKCVEALRALGFAATTNSGGAGKWPVARGELFTGADVVIFVDNDASGAKHAAIVAESVAPFASKVRTVQFQGFREKYDIADYLEEHSGGAAAVEELLAERAKEYKPDAPAAVFACTDSGNSSRFEEYCGDSICYVEETVNSWQVYTGKRWEISDAKAIQLAKSLPDKILLEAANCSDPGQERDLLKWAKTSQGVARIKAVLELSRGELLAKSDTFDTHPNLINCANGTFDVDTGEFREHRPEDRLTQMSPHNYSPTADCPQWKQFLSKIFNNDPLMIRYIQKVLGYWATGYTGERAYFTMYGDGRNGKTTLVEAIRHVLGDDYCGVLPKERIYSTGKNSNAQHPADIAAVAKKRFVTCSETDEEMKLAEATLKQFTGNDSITARGMHKDFFTIRPTFKLAIPTNHRPNIIGIDAAIWDRTKVVPFAVRIAESEIDKSLPAKLQQEAEGILAWMIEGALLWKKEEIGTCPAVEAATKDYRSEMDIVEQFLEASTKRGGQTELGFRVQCGALYDAFEIWCGKNGKEKIGNTKFSKIMKSKSFAQASAGGGRKFWTGLQLIDESRPVDDEDDDSTYTVKGTQSDESEFIL